MKQYSTTKEQWIKDRLKELHSEEDLHNKELSKVDRKIKSLIIHKKKLAEKVSKNMKHRNKLIKML